MVRFFLESTRQKIRNGEKSLFEPDAARKRGEFFNRKASDDPVSAKGNFPHGKPMGENSSKYVARFFNEGNRKTIGKHEVMFLRHF
jgi:hypothetical protein